MVSKKRRDSGERGGSACVHPSCRSSAFILSLMVGAIVVVFLFRGPQTASPKSDGGVTVAWASDARAPSFVGASACAGCHARESALWRGISSSTRDAAGDRFYGAGCFQQCELHQRGSHFNLLSGWAEIHGTHRWARRRPSRLRNQVHVWRLSAAAISHRDAGRTVAGARDRMDSRPLDKGGQRWFFLLPGRKIAKGDPLHWTA